MSESTDTEIQLHGVAGPTSFTDLVRYSKKTDGSVIYLQFIHAGPEFAVENHRTVMPWEQAKAFASELCRLLDHYPARPEPATDEPLSLDDGLHPH